MYSEASMADSFIKDPDSSETFTIVWCSKNGTNDGSTGDTGALQGETISVAAGTVPTGLTKVSENTNITTIQGVTYALNTVHNIVMSGGTEGTNYEVFSRVTTSGGRILDKTITIVCQET
jgi:hypothetical protein